MRAAAGSDAPDAAPDDRPTVRARLRARLTDAASFRSWAVDANDGVIATAGLLEGFAGAGASDHVLLTAAVAATVAGSLGLGGAKWAEAAAERETQLSSVAAETAELARDPDAELRELTDHYVRKGLDPELARRVAEQLSARDALSAQLESEYGIDRIMSAAATAWEGVSAAVAYLVGALIPLLITLFVPARMEGWILVIAVVVSLTVTSFIAARRGRVSLGRTLLRTLVVGLGTLAISYTAGLLLF